MGKVISDTYSEYVFVALSIQRAVCLRHIVICGPSRLYSVVQHYVINGTIYGKRLLNIKCVF